MIIMYNPELDGIDHINIYSRANTGLGKFLSNWIPCRLKLKEGEFRSLEGYWYWLLSDGPRRNELKTSTGWEAKKLGRELKAKDWPNDEEFDKFKSKIVLAMTKKLEQNSGWAEKFKDSYLPLTHYYVYGGKAVVPKQGQWILDAWEDIRRKMKNETN